MTTTPRFFSDSYGPHYAPSKIQKLVNADENLRLEYSSTDPSTVIVGYRQAFSFAPEEGDDGSLEGWSWAVWEYDALDERWYPTTGGDGSIGSEEGPVVDAALAWASSLS